MIRKRSKDDEIPLTVSRSTILQETKARFDTLLKAALSNDDEVEVKKNNGKKAKKSASKAATLKEIKPRKRRSKKDLSSSTQMLVSEEDQSASSEHDAYDAPSEPLHNPNLVEVKDFTPISSSDELLQSPKVNKTSPGNGDETKVLVHSNGSSLELNTSDSSPKRLVPMAQKRHSTRDESRETTSSRVSSPDSVMTTIAAASPIRSTNGSSPDKSSLKGKRDEEYELKPLRAFSASYEEIDETNLDKNGNDNAISGQTLKGMENAASYEEILEDPQRAIPERQEPESNQRISYESSRGEKVRKLSKKMKLPMSFQKGRVKEEVENTDTSSNDRVQIPSRHKRHGTQSRRKAKSAHENDIKQQDDVQYTYEKIIGITVHRCDTLKIDSHIQHPMVRIHILDTSTGEYLKKSDPNRSVSFFQESPNIDYIQPLISQPCNFKDPRSLTPIWEETLLFNEDIKHILQPNTSILILFEVLDCVSFDTALAQYKKLGIESGWHRIAWAFLKPCGPNKILNIDKRLRLQLYKPRFDKNFRGQNDCDKCDVYRWWSKGGWIQYPSTLHVTVHSLPLPSDVAPALRSYFSLQPEQCSFSPNISDNEVDDDVDNKDAVGMASTTGAANDVFWSRLPSQSCKVPNNKEWDLSSGSSGSFSIKFSHQGYYLAITAAASKSVHSIYIYKITDGSEVVRFQGHPGLVYSLDWSPNDELLLSASADCTACIWSIKSRKCAPLQMLPHPSFVYCAIFLPTNCLSLATGCCDHVIRIWIQSGQTSNFELQQELIGHDGYVSTMCVNSSGILFSGDSCGQIRMWNIKEDRSWSASRTLNVRELQGVVLSHLILHPGGKRLLVLARDSLLRIIDIGTGVAIQWFKGALNHRIHSTACISPCGSLVFSPSEDGTFYVWNADTGVLIASYTALFNNTHGNSGKPTSHSHKSKTAALVLSCSVDYHPFDHMVAFAVYGVHAPVVVCKYKKDSTGVDVGLKIQYKKEIEISEEDSSKRIQEVDPFTKSALLVSNFAARMKSKQDKKKAKQNQGFQDDRAPMLKSSQVDKPIKEESHHLSYIIKQLDYVLQLSKTSKLDQLEIETQQPASPVSPTFSLDSSLRVGSRGSSPSMHVNEDINVSLIKSAVEAENEIVYSKPRSSASKQHHTKPSEAPQFQSLKEDSSSHQLPITRAVELHYVQEKQPPRPAPRQRKPKQGRLERRKSTADMSTTDTSILSSESEDPVNSFLVKSHSPQISHKNEISHNHKPNQKEPSFNKEQVRHHNQLFSSLESDSDIQSVRIE